MPSWRTVAEGETSHKSSSPRNPLMPDLRFLQTCSAGDQRLVLLLGHRRYKTRIADFAVSSGGKPRVYLDQIALCFGGNIPASDTWW